MLAVAMLPMKQQMMELIYRLRIVHTVPLHGHGHVHVELLNSTSLNANEKLLLYLYISTFLVLKLTLMLTLPRFAGSPPGGTKATPIHMECLKLVHPRYQSHLVQYRISVWEGLGHCHCSSAV